jgi:8-oxo-dGTP pyrophosphatase MutT (NUDIX family)
MRGLMTMLTKFPNLETARASALEHGLRQRVCVYMTRGLELLVFEHTPEYPTAGIQVPAGGLEPGETLEAGALREAFEETGLTHLELQGYLGSGLYQNGMVQQVWHFVWLTTTDSRDAWAHWAEESYTFLHRFEPLETVVLHWDMDALLPELGRRLRLELTVSHPELRPVVICYLTRGTEILIFEGHPDGGTGIVAGGIEDGETPEEAASREILEECGLHLENPTYLGRQEWRFVGVNPFTGQHDEFFEDRYYFRFEILEPRDSWEWLVSDGVNDKGKVFTHRFVPLETVKIDWDMGEFLPLLRGKG